jgi:hypothetical protein
MFHVYKITAWYKLSVVGKILNADACTTAGYMATGKTLAI